MRATCGRCGKPLTIENTYNDYIEDVIEVSLCDRCMTIGEGIIDDIKEKAFDEGRREGYEDGWDESKDEYMASNKSPNYRDILEEYKKYLEGKYFSSVGTTLFEVYKEMLNKFEECNESFR